MLVTHGRKSFRGRTRWNAGEQIKRRRAFVKNQSRTLVERLLERVNPQQKIRQLGILLEHRQNFAASASPSPRMRVASATALLMVSEACRLAADLIFCASPSPSYWKRLMST